MKKEEEKTDQFDSQRLAPSQRKAYIKPMLETLGDLRALTLGGTTVGPDFSGPFTGDPLPG